MINTNSSNYSCLELIFMFPKVFEPLKFYCNTMKYSKYKLYEKDLVESWWLCSVFSLLVQSTGRAIASSQISVYIEMPPNEREKEKEHI